MSSAHVSTSVGTLVARIKIPEAVDWIEFSSSAPIEIGRQRQVEAKPPHATQLKADGELPQRLRIVVAALQDVAVSRSHALVTLTPAGTVVVLNLSEKLDLSVRHAGGATAIPPAESLTLALPLAIRLRSGECRFHRLGGPEISSDQFRSLPSAMTPPSRLHSAMPNLPTIQAVVHAGQADAVEWMQAAIDLLRPFTTKLDLFRAATDALRTATKLDVVSIISRSATGWTVLTAAGAADRGVDDPVTSDLLDRIIIEKRTLWTELTAGKSGLIVAAPILGPGGEPLAVLFAKRRSTKRNPVDMVEAAAVELFAGIVANVLARADLERRVGAFGQFFPPALAQRLLADPELLEGQDRPVTVLFTDIRNFTRISERIGPRRTTAWISAVMETLSDCVLRYDGVLVNYVGDALMAMWGAPDEQPEQARLACDAALAMLHDAPSLAHAMAEELGEEFRIGIGVNTGPAFVGNIGSTRKFQYGPLGDTVNIAARIEAATKELRCSLLVTAATMQAALASGASYNHRRVCRASLRHVAATVEVHQLLTPDNVAEIEAFPESSWESFSECYEAALKHYEQGHFRESTRSVAQILRWLPDDGPSLQLLARAAKYRAEGSRLEVGQAWEL